MFLYTDPPSTLQNYEFYPYVCSLISPCLEDICTESRVKKYTQCSKSLYHLIESWLVKNGIKTLLDYCNILRFLIYKEFIMSKLVEYCNTQIYPIYWMMIDNYSIIIPQPIIKPLGAISQLRPRWKLRGLGLTIEVARLVLLGPCQKRFLAETNSEDVPSQRLPLNSWGFRILVGVFPFRF